MSSTTAKSGSLAKSRRGAGAAVPAVSPTFANGGEPANARRKTKTKGILYQRNKGVDAYVRAVAGATAMEIVEIERQGVLGAFIKDLSKRMEVPTSRIFNILGVPKATAEKKAAAGELVSGSGGQAAVGMIKLLGIAQDIVRNSTAAEAKDFDAARWLGQWIERPQPALGGRKPADLIGTPTGVEVVVRLLGAIESGAYQ